MSDALREILAEFRIEAGKALSGLKQVDKKVEESSGAIKALADAFIGSEFVKGISGFIEGMIEVGSEVNDLSERLGIGTDDLQRFQFAAGLVGVSGEEAAKALQFLNRNLGNAIDGNKEAVETFGKLGVAIKDGDGHVRELADVFPEVADAFQGMGSDAERTAMAMKLFGRSGASLIPLLKQGAAGAAAMNEEFDRLGGGMGKDFIDAADAAGDEIDKLKFSWRGFKSQIVFGILPTVTAVVKAFQGAVGSLRRIVKETNLAKEAWLLFGAASAGATAKAAVGWAKVMGLVPKDASFWKAALGLGEFALLAGVIAVVGLAFEDLWTWIQGGDSVIGRVIDGLFGVGSSKAAVEEVRRVFGQLWDEAQALAPLFKLLGDGIAWAFKEIGVPVLAFFGKTWLQYIKANFEAGFAMIREFSKLLGDFLHESGVGMASLGKYLGNDKLQELGAKFGAVGLNLTGAAEGAPKGPQAHEIASRWGDTGPSGAVPVAATANVTNNIYGVKDAAQATQAIKENTKDGMRMAFDDAYAGGDGG